MQTNPSNGVCLLSVGITNLYNIIHYTILTEVEEVNHTINIYVIYKRKDVPA